MSLERRPAEVGDALVLVSGPSGKDRIPLDRGVITVGRLDANDIALSLDPTCSRMHCVLVRYRSEWSVRDLGSRNGTWLNGHRVYFERLLDAGDEIRVGDSRLLLRRTPGLR